jgi:hypothetical protein
MKKGSFAILAGCRKQRRFGAGPLIDPAQGDGPEEAAGEFHG